MNIPVPRSFRRLRARPAVPPRRGRLFAAAAVAATCALGAAPVAAGQAREIAVSDATELRAAMTSARAGDAIVMKDGVWKDVAIDFNASAGTAAAPIRLRARTPGKVLLTGASRLTFSAPHLVAEGLFFTDGASPGESVIEFRSHHGRLTESAIVDYNTTNPETGYAWVAFFGSDNRVDHSVFKGKTNDRPVITNRGPGFRRNQVDHTYFTGIRHVPKNGREIIQIMGYGMSEEMGDDGAFFTVERNLFEEAHGEGMEIISIKSNRNAIRFNTFRKTKGGITNRSGNFNTIEGNIILGEKEPGSYGIRVTGRQQTVVNNYVADVDGAGLLLVAGEHIAPLTPAYQPIVREGAPLGRVPRYAQVQDSLFAHNTLVDCGEAGIEVGSSYKAGWPAAQRVLVPEGNQIVNNIIFQSGGAATIKVTEPERAGPLDVFQFASNAYTGTIVFGGPVTGLATTGLRIVDPQLRKAGGLWRPAPKSPAIDSAAAGHVASVVTVDIDGQPRKGAHDAGADEVSGAAAPRQPLRPDDVGPAWVKALRRAGDARFR